MAAQTITIAMLFGLVLVWYYYLATEEEIDLYYNPIFRAFVTITLGFIFYRLRFPEKYLTVEKYGARMAYIS